MSKGERLSSRRLMLASFMTSSFATQPPGLITMLLLIEIGLTFGQQVGISGQIRTLSSIVGLIVSLLLGALSIKFSSRSLLLTGLLLLNLSAIGCSIAWNFTSMLFLYSISGMAINMINPMIKTLIGSHFPQEERSKVLGWSAAGTSIAYLVFSPLVSFIAGFARWRMTFLVVMLPLSLLALATTFIGIPQATSDQISENTHGFFAGFRSIFSNKSAIFCLLGTMLTWASFTGTLTYGISFFRERFSVTVGWASLLLSAMALSKTVGHLLIGSLVTRAGRKSAVVASVISTALFTAFYLMSKNLWLSIVLVCISCVLAGFMHSSVDSLNLEQVPEFHGSMMSLGSAASTIGSVIGSGLGGLILIFYGYSGVGAILGLLGLVSGIVYQIFALDPSANNVS